MTLSDFATFSTAVSGLAVTVSLIYLALQTHQNAKHTKALIRQGRATRMADAYSAFSDADGVAAVLSVLDQPSTPENMKLMRGRMFFLATIVGWSDAFKQFQVGLLDSDELADLGAGVRSLIVAPRMRHFWEQWKAARPRSHVQFKAWIDGLVDQASPAA